MATIYWLGTADPVAQVAFATFATYDVATTRKITIGGVTIQAADSGGTLTTAMTALAVLLNASTDPYFSAITWTSNATQIIGTADTAGVPFVFLAAVSGGTGTVSNTYGITTASAGPNDWSTATNWSGAAVPVSTDTAVLRDSAVDVLWGLDQSAVTLTALVIEKSYTGKVGLNRVVFQTSATDSDTTKTEYRTTYLKISATSIKIGENNSQSTPSGSSRIMIDTGSNASTCEIFDTASTPSESGRPSIRLKFNHSTSVLFVRSAPGGVGVALDAPGETSTLATISISDVTSGSKVYTGSGVTLTTWTQSGGVNIQNLAATLTTLNMVGGALSIEGTHAITTINISGGTLSANSTGTITTLNLTGGTIDFQESNRARTVTTANLTKGTMKADGSVMTVTTINDPAGKYSLVAS